MGSKIHDVSAIDKSLSEFKGWISSEDGSRFKPEPNRYHLYTALACPFAHRVLIARALKGLEDVISVTVSTSYKSPAGWMFTDEGTQQTIDTLNGKHSLKEIYELVQPGYSGKVSVPLLWDKKENTIVCNDSAMLLRNLNMEFNDLGATEEQRKLDLYPEHLRGKIEEVNDWVTPNINFSVYKAGNAKTQTAYDEAIHNLFSHLDKVDEILSKQRYLVGDELTEADVRLFVTLIRFDWVYHTLYKCNKKMIKDYPNIFNYLREIYQMSGVSETVNREVFLKTYYRGVVAVGPDLDFSAPHDRDRFPKK